MIQLRICVTLPFELSNSASTELRIYYYFICICFHQFQAKWFTWIIFWRRLSIWNPSCIVHISEKTTIWLSCMTSIQVNVQVCEFTYYCYVDLLCSLCVPDYKVTVWRITKQPLLKRWFSVLIYRQGHKDWWNIFICNEFTFKNVLQVYNLYFPFRLHALTLMFIYMHVGIFGLFICTN